MAETAPGSIPAATIASEDLSETCRRVTLAGRLDMVGSEAITMRFASLTAVASRRVIVDLTGVTFLASVGIRDLISNAKAVAQRGGRMVLLVGGNDLVAKTLEATGIGAIVPIYANEAEAVEAALG